MRRLVNILIEDMALSHGLDLSPYLLQEGSKNTPKLLSIWSIFWRYFIADFLFSYSIVTIAVVGFWRGTWDYSVIYLDQMLFDGKKYQSLILMFVIGFLGVQVVQTCHSLFKRHTLSKQSKFRYRFNSKVFSLFWGFMDIFLWRSVWESIDLIFLQYTSSLTLGVFTLCTGAIVLTLTKSLRSSLSLPSGITMDDEFNRVHACTYFETNADSGILWIMGDSLASTILEGFVISCWHGVWSIADVITHDHFTTSHASSGLYSYIIGFFIGIICLFGQFILYHAIWNNPHRSKLLKLAFNFMFTLLALIGTILAFRGVWYMWDSYFLTGNWSASLVLSQILGGLILFNINCGSSLHAGIVKDLYPEDGLIINYHYFTYYYSREFITRHTNEEERMDSALMSQKI